MIKKIIASAFIIVYSASFAQNPFKGLYIGISPNMTFNKLTQNDTYNGLSSRIGSSFGLSIGYHFKLNQKFTISTDVNMVSLNRKIKYKLVGYTGNNIPTNPIIKLKLNYIIPLSKSFFLSTTLGIGTDIVNLWGGSNYTVVSDSGSLYNDSINTLEIAEFNKASINIYAIASISLLKINKKRNTSISLTFNKGIINSYYVTSTRWINKVPSVAYIIGTNTHVELNFILFLKKNKPTNDLK